MPCQWSPARRPSWCGPWRLRGGPQAGGAPGQGPQPRFGRFRKRRRPHSNFERSSSDVSASGGGQRNVRAGARASLWRSALRVSTRRSLRGGSESLAYLQAPRLLVVMGNSSAGAATLSQLCGAVTPGLADANAQRRAFAPPGLCIQPILLSTVSFLFCSAALSAVPDTGSGLLLPQRLHRVTTATGPDRRRRVVGGALSTAVLRAAAHPARHPRGGSNSLHRGLQSPAWAVHTKTRCICGRTRLNLYGQQQPPGTQWPW